MPLVLSGWSAARTSNIGPPKCSALATKQERGITRRGFTVFCGPASAVVMQRGIWHVLKNGVCRDGRLYFGALGPRRARHVFLGLQLDSRDHPGTVNIRDGEIELVPPGTVEALSGTALIEPGLDSGTFNAYGRDANGPVGDRFVGAWNCG
jgi:hypothetical protein